MNDTTGSSMGQRPRLQQMHALADAQEDALRALDLTYDYPGVDHFGWQRRVNTPQSHWSLIADR